MDSRRVIIVLSVSLAVSLVAVGFLIGRESNRPSPLLNVPVIAPTLPAITEPAPPLPSIAAAPSPARPAPPKPPTGPHRLTAPSPLPADGDTSEKAAVERYFAATDPLQNADVDNPEAAGNSLMEAASSGDLSGLRALTAKAHAAEAKARALTPPPACAAYHQQLLRLLGQNRGLFQRLESGIGGGDVGELPALLEQANGAKAHADALAREEHAVKKRFGITR